MAAPESENVTWARDYIAGVRPGSDKQLVDELVRRAKALRNEQQITLSRRLLARAWAMDPTYRRLRHDYAVSTYKDPELPVAKRLKWAEEILKHGTDVRDDDRQEAFGIAGAIAKRNWEVDRQREHLDHARHCYEQGYELGPSIDDGYTGINAAFVSDLLASLEAPSGGGSSAQDHRERAEAIRKNLVAVLTDKLGRLGDEELRTRGWWPLATLAEAHFGLRQYDPAKQWLETARRLVEVPEWELESTARQLGQLTRLHEPGIRTIKDFQASAAYDALSPLSGSTGALFTAYYGKVGLALSGGGYRASLFHLGVLARLAELDLLRHVEVLSCVSGGSIVGAHYYLKVRQLLQSTADDEVTAQHYVDLVDELIGEFLAGVQRNLRTRVAAELRTNLRMLVRPSYTRTLVAGSLFEKAFFSKVRDGDVEPDLRLRMLGVQPKDQTEVKTRYGNWSRMAKVPTLILNATSLNTGHNWQFTTSRMGEPPDAFDATVDTNERLRRLSYDDAPGEHRDLRLGDAVAASAAVPGLFDPLVLAGLYPDRTVRLVDGGVQDNQGEVGLLEQGCTVVLVSDASGHMNKRDDPSGRLFGVLTRTNSILMSRVRQAQYLDLAARKQSNLLRGLVYLHLQKDLDVETVDWEGSKDRYNTLDDPRSSQSSSTDPLTPYGIHKDIQRLLAGIRTDLDSFCDAEAYALMASGYCMTEQELSKHSLLGGHGSEHAWPFQQILPALKAGGKPTDRLPKLLAVANKRAFKIWHLVPWLRWAGLVGVILLGLLVLAILRWVTVPALVWGWLGWILAVVVLIAGAAQLIAHIANLRIAPSRLVIGLGLALGGFLAAMLHLHVFDRWYLHRGKLEQVIKR